MTSPDPVLELELPTDIPDMLPPVTSSDHWVEWCAANREWERKSGLNIEREVPAAEPFHWED
jgi:hypothetical protein